MKPAPAVEIELKFAVPRQARAALRAALVKHGAQVETRRLLARYFDTPDRRLARAGMSLRLRREDGRWVQTLKSGVEGSPVRFEHEVERPDDTLDVRAHDGTDAGSRLAALLAGAGAALEQRYGTDIRRTLRRVRAAGALVELAFDEGRIVAGERTLSVCELECELLSGSPAALFSLAGRWRARFGLLLDPGTKAERGDALSEARPVTAPRRASGVALARKVHVADAWRAVLDECIAQVLANAAGLTIRDRAGSTDDQAERVHQLRIGLRRLRSAIRLFRGWVEPAPEAVASGAHELSRKLGAMRDRDVLTQTIETALQRAGAPQPSPHPAAAPARRGRADAPAALIAADSTQQFLLGLLAWRVGLDEDRRARTTAADGVAPPAVPVALATPARARLRRWHRAICRQSGEFGQLDDAARHLLRRRVKRLRYASEFLARLFPRKAMRRLLERLDALQQALGDLGDLALAHERYGGAAERDPRTWFALGWVAARRDALAQQAAVALAALDELRPFDAAA